MSFFEQIPIFWAKVIITLLYLLLALWVWRRSKSYVLEGAPTKRNWRDLRLWALLLIGIQMALYLIF
jgi:hypothetical protein